MRGVDGGLIAPWGARCGWLVWILLLAPGVWAGGPRYVAGPPFFTGYPGLPVVWRQTQLSYFTDAGDLSATVNHAAADRIVAAAAAVWNLSVANITLSQGGELAEHVSGGNTYLGPSGMVFPADVMSANAAAAPIAVIYDTDGSVTDTLLGEGASGPAECGQNGVTESVDEFDPQGYILHAVVVVNGRCAGAGAGTAPAQQLQYQLMRVFGRVLGLAWSQTNDNVFTGAMTPTYAQEMLWPIMHPIDILCGSYSYQCLPNPFQLRPDDVAAMVQLYPVTQSGAGVVGGQAKQWSFQQATGLFGFVTFPTGQGMAGVNVLVRRQSPGAAVTDGGYEASGVTGTQFRRAAVSPFVTAGTDPLASEGTWDQGRLGYYSVGWLAMLAGPGGSVQTAENLLVTLEPVNPLYAGEHSVGPYALGAVAMSGTAPVIAPIFGADEGGVGQLDVTIPTAAGTCGSGTDGTAAAPAQIPATGWWNGLLCGFGHASYGAAQVKPGRTFTLEVTALDGNGYATTSKARPVIGVYAPTDGPWDLPSVAAAATAFQALGVGTTRVAAATGAMTSVRVGIADERGDGRPDFAYQARMFYADSVTPAKIATAGGTVTIAGSGFRAGNAVAINGTAVTVLSWGASAVVVRAPARSVVGAGDKVPVDVTVTDSGTGAASTMSAVLTYDSDAGLPNAMRLMSVQSAAMYVGDVAGTAFAVQVVEADGVTPVSGDTVVFSGAGAVFGCGAGVTAASCTVVTNAQGIAVASVTPMVAGTVAVQAVDGTLSQTGNFMALAQVGSVALVSAPAGTLNVGMQAGTAFAVKVLDAGGNAVAGAPVTFTASTGGAAFSPCVSSTCVVMTDGNGVASSTVTPTAVGAVTLRAGVGDAGQQVSISGASGVDVMQVVGTPGEPAYPYTLAGNFIVRLQHPGGSADTGETVTFNGPAGVDFVACGTNMCAGVTDWTGAVGFTVQGVTAGVYPLTAAFGGVVQTLTFTVTNHSVALSVVSVPGAYSPAEKVAPIPFAVQLVQDGLNPVSGASVVLSGARGDEVMGCGQEFCAVYTDGNGMAAMSVMPLRAGVIPLSAEYLPATVTTSFTATGVPPSLRVIETVGPGGAMVGVPQVLIVQMIGADGITPVTNHDLIYMVTSGPFGFTSCSAATCDVRTDNNGYAAIAGTALGAGPVTVQVTDGQVLQAFQFNAVALPDVLRVVSQPAAGGFVGRAAAMPFAVQVLFNGGVTPASGRNVTVSVTNASAGLAACAGAAGCALTTDANGMISTAVTPLAAGLITLTVVDGGVSATASFMAVTPPDVMVVEAAPAGPTVIGTQAASAFTVAVFAADGVTPRVGKSVVFTVAAGSALLGCGAASCTVTTGAGGSASMTVTPLLAGTITLQAVEASLAQTVSFTAVRPDSLSVVSVPANGSFVGLAAAAFTVRLLQGDGVTPDTGKAVTLSASGATLGCGSSSCVVMTGADGSASTTVTATLAGTVGLQAAMGTVTATASFMAAMQPDVLRVASAPGSGALVGVAAVFSLRLTLWDGVTPDAGKTVAVTANGATLGCGAAICPLVTDANGLVSTSVTPTVAGVVTLIGSVGSLIQTATFTAINRPDTMQVVAVPANGALVGDAAGAFAVRVFEGDGVTPAVGRSVTVSVTNGLARLSACGTSSCTLTTNVSGEASTGVVPLSVGVIGLTASEGSGGAAAVTASFTAKAKPDLVAWVNTPGTSVYQGASANSPLAVKVVLADGVTPVAGIAVTFAAAPIGVSFGACGTAICVVLTGADGVAATSVTGLQVGAVELTAAAQVPSGVLTLTTPFTVLANQYQVTTGNAPVFMAEGAEVSLTLATVVAKNGAAAAGQAMHWSSPGGFGLTVSDTVTNSIGASSVAATLGPLAGGQQATATACALSNVCASFSGVGVAQANLQPVLASGGVQTVSGGAAYAPVGVKVVDASGDAVAGAAVSIYQTVTAVDAGCPARGRCAAAPVMGSNVVVVVSGMDGMVWVTPLNGVGSTQTEIAVSVGTQGFVSTVLGSQP